MVRGLLTRAAAEGLPGDHHFYLTFGTTAPGVGIAPRLRHQYPEEMTIVLQHQFWDLSVDGDAFSVTLRFGASSERLTVPFLALRAFADPSCGFGLRLAPETAAPAPAAPAGRASSSRGEVSSDPEGDDARGGEGRGFRGLPPARRGRLGGLTAFARGPGRSGRELAVLDPVRLVGLGTQPRRLRSAS